MLVERRRIKYPATDAPFTELSAQRIALRHPDDILMINMIGAFRFYGQFYARHLAEAEVIVVCPFPPGFVPFGQVSEFNMQYRGLQGV
ncbi:MAG: hypothetical protein BWX80_03215 [Candidatus Hydrogenedentes bacterium ADurb.Bin101]|nr:MAG: hypothetical protein BWX80_03215 [Candidatus Hydrogenedentes bacterium ADurb.Bin101]